MQKYVDLLIWLDLQLKRWRGPRSFGRAIEYWHRCLRASSRNWGESDTNPQCDECLFCWTTQYTLNFKKCTCDQSVGLIISSDSGLGWFDWQKYDITDNKDAFSLLFVVWALEQAHDFSRDSEVRMAEHFGGGSDMDVDFGVVLGLFASPESDFVGLVLADSLLNISFLHNKVI